MNRVTGLAVPDVGWMADRLAGPEPPGALVLQRQLDLAVDHLDRHLAVGLEPAAEVLVRGHAVGPLEGHAWTERADGPSLPGHVS
jgi:hypothetical protein